LCRGALVIAATKLFSKHLGELLAFFTAATTSAVKAPSTGSRSLEAHW
jgi:hypothetical protein